ncbi:MAG: carboxylesterase family protein [Tannerellaceae bacterium]|nr:carboxylesterase family protein [Tannerellaceae bacterium]
MKLNRRNFIKEIGVGTVAASVATPLSLISCSTPAGKVEQEEEGPVIRIGEDIAIADTAYGKVKGYIKQGIYTFLGIPYGADTSGKNRFMPPQPPEPWQGVRPTVFYGPSAPQEIYSRASTSYGMFVDHWNYDELSEDCLCLNIWTPEANDANKRPVIVWLHGGGYSRGNGIEQDSYHGENIARYGNVVFCSVNHRLGAIGFTDLSAVGGEKYRDSGNAGLLDMVAALQWVHRNIAGFGGDPGNVTIMGQSGGGGKVCLLATMPETKGLIHKGVALSGSAVSGNNKKYSEQLGSYILKEAGLSPSQVDQLQEIPWENYLQIAHRAAAQMEREVGDSGMRRGSFGPVADGIHLPQEPFFSDRTGRMPDIPMLFCTTFHEQSPSRTNAALEEITLQGVTEEIRKQYGDRAEMIVKAYTKAFPQVKPIEILCLIQSNRLAVIETATAKLQQTSPVYMAWFGWCPPLFDHRIRAFHCLDISFWFMNTDRMYTHTGGGARPRTLSQKMADALLAFVRTGDPNCEALPNWPVYTAAKGETMILNDPCEVQEDPDREARQTLI